MERSLAANPRPVPSGEDLSDITQAVTAVRSSPSMLASVMCMSAGAHDVARGELPTGVSRDAVLQIGAMAGSLVAAAAIPRRK